MQNNKTIGIVGATGIVGLTLIDILCKNNYSNNLKLSASDKSIGKVLEISNNNFNLVKLDDSFFDDINFVFFCTDTDISKKWVPFAMQKNIFITDCSSAFRMCSDVPLIIPEINGNLIEKCNGLVASPNCVSSLLSMCLFPLINNLSNINKIYVTTYQAVSGAGLAGIKELELQTKQFSNGEELFVNTFKSQIYGNCFSHNSQIDINNGYNEEELKVINETNKILNTNIEISPTCVRVPVFTSHSLDVTIIFENSVNEKDIRNTLNKFNGVQILDDRLNNNFPEPFLTSGKTDVLIGRIRPDFSDKTNKIYKLWICGDQLLKGASYNAFQIFKKYEDIMNLITDSNFKLQTIKTSYNY